MSRTQLTAAQGASRPQPAATALQQRILELTDVFSIRAS